MIKLDHGISKKVLKTINPFTYLKLKNCLKDTYDVKMFAKGWVEWMNCVSCREFKTKQQHWKSQSHLSQFFTYFSKKKTKQNKTKFFLKVNHFLFHQLSFSIHVHICWKVKKSLSVQGKSKMWQFILIKTFCSCFEWKKLLLKKFFENKNC